jgi:prepilin-type N-terminal cleavage/methylation domain-containing protein
MMGPALSRHSRRRRKGFTLIEMLVVIVIILILAGLLLPAVIKAICQGRAASMESLLESVAQACAMYKTDNGDNPKSNPSFESKVLVEALSKPNLRHGQYFAFKDTQIDKKTGNIANAVQAEDWVKYRNNYLSDSKAKGLHNKSGIDMWTSGCDGVQDSINNWD